MTIKMSPALEDTDVLCDNQYHLESTAIIPKFMMSWTQISHIKSNISVSFAFSSETGIYTHAMQMLKVVKYDLHMTDDGDCKRIMWCSPNGCNTANENNF